MIAVLVAAVVASALLVRFTEPGALPRYRHASRYHRDGKARHAIGYKAPLAIAAPVESSAVATIPDPAPFVRTA